MNISAHRKPGTLYWITGLSGAGKTTLAIALYELLSKKKNNVILMDGDQLREVFGNDLGYEPEDRLKCAERYSRLCELISAQGLDVICATISLFHTVQRWNRENIENYVEIYLDMPKEMQSERNAKGLYDDKGSKKTVAINQYYQAPMQPEFHIHSDKQENVDSLARIILKQYGNN